MFGYICMAMCFILARYSRPEYRVISYLLAFEFLAHKIVYVIGDQLLSIPGSLLYTLYLVSELIAMSYLILFKSHLAIITFILISLVYNALVVSQYSYPVYDYMQHYQIVMKTVMLLEMVYLGMLTAYVANFRRKHGFINASHIDRMFFIWPGALDWLYMERTSR